ncbi:hypothetical protein [Emticicia sp.]|uniref:hypothetical protein n=1 Tax=Emticicia sp. TaxID=1930953 RepID=UPI0037528D92
MTLQPTLRIVTDDVAIIDCLVDNNEIFKSFDTNKTASFIVGEDYHLVFYFADSQVENRFMMYIVDDFSENTECMGYILNHLDEQIKENKQENSHFFMIKQAKSKVLDVLYMTDTFRALFGKNTTHETSELSY